MPHGGLTNTDVSLALTGSGSGGADLPPPPPFDDLLLNSTMWLFLEPAFPFPFFEDQD